MRTCLHGSIHEPQADFSLSLSSYFNIGWEKRRGREEVLSGGAGDQRLAQTGAVEGDAQGHDCSGAGDDGLRYYFARNLRKPRPGATGGREEAVSEKIET